MSGAQATGIGTLTSTNCTTGSGGDFGPAAQLASGALAMVFNEASAKDATEQRASLYDEIDDGDGRVEAVAKGRAAFWGAPRAPMTVALSADGGKSWQWQRNLDEGDG